MFQLITSLKFSDIFLSWLPVTYVRKTHSLLFLRVICTVLYENKNIKEELAMNNKIKNTLKYYRYYLKFRYHLLVVNFMKKFNLYRYFGLRRTADHIMKVGRYEFETNFYKRYGIFSDEIGL